LAWIEFHPTRIKKLKKFSDFRKAANWSVHEALGFLGEWWGQTLEVSEDGDVSGWDADYLSELIGLGAQVSSRVWEALVTFGWIDKTADGKLLVHDWPDWAGRFLRAKYSDNRQRLVEIWALHGRVYGEKHTDIKPTSNRQVTDTILSFPSLPNPKALALFERFWEAYPKKRSKGQAEKAWKKLAMSEGLFERIMAAIQKARASPDWQKDHGQYIPYPATWLNAKGWEDDVGGVQKPKYRSLTDVL
jgi:hypothetical protein